MTKHKYAVVDAPGTYGSHTTVRRVFGTIMEADAYAHADRYVVIQDDSEPGTKIHAQDAQRYAARADAVRDERRKLLNASRNAGPRDHDSARALQLFDADHFGA